ncbi:uncharacterized protein N7483_001190 [Penicillium malachiteum]|uniref:uncharacterized protein n=1 Tax=Penicillium malachiteum TaxID=1324776 RepID=UPI0025492AD4|nr:uncharacterized protein N7483_001190 [Penicillium malachiteum]KAJ5736065.1 hypothetical protein N7483_001190 [Penicillium malachiteum]
MPLTDSHQPPLEPEEREIVKYYNGWTNYMFSYCLKPWNDDDAEEGKAILEAMIQHDKEAEHNELEENHHGYIDDCSYHDEDSNDHNDSFNHDGTHNTNHEDDSDSYDHETETAVDDYAGDYSYEDYGDLNSDECYWDY